jgi:hypothetical protein
MPSGGAIDNTRSETRGDNVKTRCIKVAASAALVGLLGASTAQAGGIVE